MRPMKTVLPLVLLALASACAVPAPKQAEAGGPAPPPSHVTAEHEWLHHLAGDWMVKGEAVMGPDAPAQAMEWTERARMFGDYWLVSDIEADFDGDPWKGRMTIGWDGSQNAFVGTWYDTNSDYMWTYHGSLDAERRVLTLEAEGPDMTNPGKMTMFRDVLEILGPNKRRLSSYAYTDGEWVRFMGATATRR